MLLWENKLILIRRGEKVARDSYHGGEFGVGFFLGLLAGAVLALVMAPQAGEVTRRQIADRATELKDSAEELVEQARHNLEEAGMKVERILGNKDRGIRRKIDEIKSELDKYDLEEI
jgi:gas vesicle protein